MTADPITGCTCYDETTRRCLVPGHPEQNFETLKVSLYHNDRCRIPQGLYEFDSLAEFADFLLNVGRINTLTIEPMEDALKHTVGVRIWTTNKEPEQ